MRKIAENRLAGEIEGSREQFPLIVKIMGRERELGEQAGFILFLGFIPVRKAGHPQGASLHNKSPQV